LEGLRVLIAEDEPISRLMLQRAVQQSGHQCQAATNGAEAWELFQAAEFEVIITDWMMPLLDGLELCQRVRAQPKATYTYLILLTSLGDKAHFVEGMEAGADDYLAKPFDPEELRARLIAAARVTALHQRLAEQNAELAELNLALAESARTDPLTGLSNRLRLWEDLRRVHSQFERYGHQYAVALWDVDHFKAYNDHFGHSGGDEALCAVARTIAAEARTGDRAYRYGGEEFFVLLVGQLEDGAIMAMNRIREAVQSLAIPHPGNMPSGVLTISGGIAIAHKALKRSPEHLIQDADAALYRAKDAGRNRVVAFTSTPGVI